ncbi:MAG: hypothetical protein GY870_15135, partial [archaeon]|nr:hypothetical protein [archaeon]
MSMKNIKVWRIFSLSTSLSMILFFTCVICAMFVWPDGYHLFFYCISDLGMVVTYEGNLNIYSSILLFLACLSSSFGGIAFYSMLFFILRHKNTWPLYIGVIMGWVAQYFLMGVAVFPEDTEPMLHQVSAMCFFVFSMVGWFLLLFCIKDCNINRNYKYLG